MVCAILLALVAMPAPPPPATSWPPLYHVYVRHADGMDHLTRCWPEGFLWRWREVDQYIHPPHLASPPEVWQQYGGQCDPNMCKPLPPGAMPGERWRMYDPPQFLGAPE